VTLLLKIGYEKQEVVSYIRGGVYVSRSVSKNKTASRIPSKVAHLFQAASDQLAGSMDPAVQQTQSLALLTILMPPEQAQV